MAYKIITKCPVCNSNLTVQRLKCKKCGTIIENEFELSKLSYLNQEQLKFIEVFLECRGNIKDVEKELGISYPTVRSKLDEVIIALGFSVEKKAVVPGGIIYKIQIGAYKGKIPESANKLIKKISMIRKVENYIDDKGLKIYTTGNLRLFSEAVTMLSQVKQEGIKTAVINAYQNGKKITVMEARKLNHEL